MLVTHGSKRVKQISKELKFSKFMKTSSRNSVFELWREKAEIRMEKTTLIIHTPTIKFFY